MIETRTNKKTTSKKWLSRWKKAVITLGALTVFSTTYALILPAITASTDTFCGHEEHKHTEACYTRELICGLEEGKSGSHTETIIDTEVESVLVDEGHTHTDACYETVTTLVCGQEESEEHTHSDACYETSKVLVCGQEERAAVYEEKTVQVEREVVVEEAAHKHTDACYKSTLTCKKEEHEHSDACFANTSADLETASVWERTLPDKKDMTGVWAEDTLLIAKSQVGYTESSVNFIVQDGERKGYTRYGAMMGIPYGDWCAMFIQFSLHYAEVDSKAFPTSANVPAWTDNAKENDNFYAPSDYTPEEANIIFFDWNKNGTPDHVGIVEKVDNNKVYTIEGNSGNAVRRNTYELTDKNIYGYAIIPEKETAEEAIEIEDIELPFTGADVELGNQAAVATIYTDETYTEVASDNTSIVITGELPVIKTVNDEGEIVEDLAVEVKVYQVEAPQIDDTDAVLAYDITIFYKEGCAPEGSDGTFQPVTPLKVAFENDVLADDSVDSYSVYHIKDNGETEYVGGDNSLKDNGVVAFDAHHFSPYLIHVTPINPETYGAYPEDEDEENAAESEEAVDTATIDLKAVTETGVEVIFSAPVSAIPEDVNAYGLILKAEEIKEGTAKYISYEVKAATQVVTDEYTEITNARFFDVTLMDGDEEVRINDDAHANVSIIFPETEEVAMDSNLDVVQISAEGTEVIDAETTIVDESLEEIAFAADDTNVFGVIETKEITTRFISASGTIYDVTVTYDVDAEIPDGATLDVTEYDENTEEYKTAYEIIPQGTETAISTVLDITIHDESGNEIEPAAPVDVKIDVISPEDNVEQFSRQVYVTHIKEENGEMIPEAMESEQITETAGEDVEIVKTINFTVDSFSHFLLRWDEGGAAKDARIFAGYTLTREGKDIFHEFPRSGNIQLRRTDGSGVIGYQGISDIPQTDGAVYSLNTNPEKGDVVKVYYLNKTQAETANTDNTILNNSAYTEIEPELRVKLVNGTYKWQYKVKGGGWTDSNIVDDDSEIYVIYDEVIWNSTGQVDSNGNAILGGSAIDTNPAEIPELGEPKHEKTLTKNNDGDGTYTVSLNVTGEVAVAEQGTYADVIIIRDTTGSMNTQASSSTGTRTQVAEKAIEALVNELISYNDVRSDSVKISSITFNQLATIQSYGTFNREQAINTTVHPTNNGGQTNWEDPLFRVSEIQTRANAKQYVIFITDGNPNLRNTAGPYINREYYTIYGDTVGAPTFRKNFGEEVYNNPAERAYYWWDQGQNGRTNYPYGFSNDNASYPLMYANCTQYAEDIAYKINEAGMDFYVIGAFWSGKERARLESIAAAGGASQAYYADDYDSFMEAFRPLVEQIRNDIKYRDITIKDTLTLPTASALVDGDAKNFNYFRYGGTYGDPWEGIATSNTDYYNVDGTKKAFAELPKSVKAKYAWTPPAGATAEFKNERTNGEHDTEITWSLGSDFALEHNVTYEVEVTVWPDQLSYDWAVAYSNGETPNQVPAAFVKPGDSYPVGEGTATATEYAVRTNNTASHKNHVQYDVVKTTNGVETIVKDNQQANYPDPGVMPLDMLKIRLLKEWANDADSQKLKNLIDDTLSFKLNKDGSTYKDNITLNKANDWKSSEEYNLSIGLLISDPYQMDPTAIGKFKSFNLRDENNNLTVYYLLDEGHTFEFEEKSSSANFTFVPNSYHPFLIDGVPKMVEVTKQGAWRIVGDATEYAVGTNTAKGYEKGNLTISKMIINSETHNMIAEQKTGFDFVVTITDKNGVAYSAAKADGTPWDTNTAIGGHTGITYKILDRNGNVVKDSPLGNMGQVIDSEGNRVLPNNAKSSSSVTFSLRDGWSIVFNDLPVDSKWSVKEPQTNDAYMLEGYVNSASRLEQGNTDHMTTDSDGKVNGSVVLGDTFIDVHNVHKPSEVKIKKLGDGNTNNPLSGAEFQLITAREMPESYVGTYAYVNVWEQHDLADGAGNYGATYISAQPYWNHWNNSSVTGLYTPTSGTDVGYFVSKTTGERATNSLGRWIRYMPTEVRSDNIVFTTGTDGMVSLGELPNGTYLLYETKAPNGYKKLEYPITIEVDAYGQVKANYNGQSLTVEDGKINGHYISGTITVINSSGQELPATGGIGTTIITAAGLILMMAALILLTLKRVASKRV